MNFKNISQIGYEKIPNEKEYDEVLAKIGFYFQATVYIIFFYYSLFNFCFIPSKLFLYNL